MTKKILAFVAASLLVCSFVSAGELVNVSGASGIAIDGYDPVAFFTMEKPVHGNPSVSATHKGATYLFSSEQHKALFVKNPDKYAPAFGGFCAYGISVGALFPADIDTWQIRDGKLYFNLNPEIVKAFNADFDGNIKKAKKNWSGLQSEHAGSAR